MIYICIRGEKALFLSIKEKKKNSLSVSVGFYAKVKASKNHLAISFVLLYQEVRRQ
jgi:hypothetical protein